MPKIGKDPSSLVHLKLQMHIVRKISNTTHIFNSKTNVALAPALVETYCRLLVFSEIESLGIKGLLNQLLPLLFKPAGWGILHAVLEMFSYRLHYIQAQLRLSLLSHLQVTFNLKIYFILTLALLLSSNSRKKSQNDQKK